MSKAHDTGSTSRFLEIVGILRKHKIILGVTPEKLRLILEDLGPTFVKLGQLMSMRTDVLPIPYCEELQKLRSEVKPMSPEEVERVVEASLGVPLRQAFPSFDRTALGSASIAQAHRATLPGGESVVVKVQREGIHEKMASDIALLHKAAGLLKFAPTGDTVDLNMVLDEMWAVSQQEMNFLSEAANAEEFRRLNEAVAYVGCPRIYREVSTRQVLVMEAVDGLRIDDLAGLKAQGYDPEEISRKLCTNYIKQVLDDGFFHADPHPGNLRIRDGQIVWLDLGMVGRLSEHDKSLFDRAITAAVTQDTGALTDAVLAISKHSTPVRRDALYTDVDAMLSQYLHQDVGSLNLGELMQHVLEIAQRHRLAMPSGVTMLGRGVSTLEGLIADLSPQVSVLDVFSERFAQSALRKTDWKLTIGRSARAVYESAQKSLSTPALLNDALRAALKGELRLRLEEQPAYRAEQSQALRAERLRRTLLLCSLLLGSSLMTLSPVEPRWAGLPWPAVMGFSLCAGFGGVLWWQSRRRNRRGD